jgi:hypothetical protein
MDSQLDQSSIGRIRIQKYGISIICCSSRNGNRFGGFDPSFVVGTKHTPFTLSVTVIVAVASAAAPAVGYAVDWVVALGQKSLAFERVFRIL